MDRIHAHAQQAIPYLQTPVGNSATPEYGGKRRLRVISDNMFDPADPHGSWMVDDIVTFDLGNESKDGDSVLVLVDGKESLMKLTIKDGVRAFRYAAPDMAGFLLTDADVVIVGIAVERCRLYASSLSGPLKWRGDDIGLRNEWPIHVILVDSDGRDHLVSLREALMVADQLDEIGRDRITVALALSAEGGHLRPMDLAVWREFESDQLFIKTGKISHA